MDLVVGASEATMKSLLSKLGGLLAHEYTLIAGVRGDVQYINDELASMQAFLGDLSAVPSGNGHDRRMKDWMKQIRDVTYDIEDCVDDFAHRLSHDPRGGFVVSRVYEILTWWPRRDIALKIAELKVRAQQIGEWRTRYGVENPKIADDQTTNKTPTGFDAAENQQTSPQLVDTKIPVGVDKDMDELGKWIRIASIDVANTTEAETRQPQITTGDLSSQNPTGEPVPQMEQQDQTHRQAVLSIVGFGGVGKTTIATALYQKFGDQFDRRATVTVSQSSDIVPILRNILSQVMPKSKDDNEQQLGSDSDKKRRLLSTIATKLRGHQEHDQIGVSDGDLHTMKLEQLNKDLKKQLEKNSYLLLIDDVWSATTWEQIKKSLPASEKGSRVIVTTRFQAVASTCRRGKGDYIHKMSVLSADKPKELFMKVLAESNTNKDDEETTQRITPPRLEKKLSKLRSSRHGEQNQPKKILPPRLWEMCGGLPLAIVTMAGLVACNPENSEEDWYNVCTSLVPDSVKALTQDGVSRILSHCYNDMPAEIKTCSLYLSIFPKGYVISRKRLTRRWIAEGFVSEKQGLGVEDVAETYFNHLIRRKIIRPVEHSSNGKVKSYQVHDMILEFIVSKSSEENFVTVVGGHWLMPPPSSKVRRLSIQGGESKHGNAIDNMNLSHVRSLSMFGTLNHLHSSSFKFGIVQVLDLDGCKGFKKHHTKDICKMLLLKYLSLRRTDIKKLPKKIGKLQYLETLDIRETSVKELPKTTCQLERVINILGGNKRTREALKLPEDLKKKTMKSLRILSGIEIDVQEPTAVADLHHLTDLRKLAIYKLNVRKGDKLFKDLSSSIEYLGGYSLQILIIDDESSEFLESLDDLSSPPKFLKALELSGKLVRLPNWITELEALTKLTLSITALREDALEHLCQLKTLFSLMFSLSAEKQDLETAAILEENKKAHSDGEIIFPTGGFEKLKLLRFSSPLVPMLSFPENAMPGLERLELRFSILEGLYGVENLKNLKEMHLRIHDKAGEVTRMIVEEVAVTSREYENGPRIIIDQYQE